MRRVAVIAGDGIGKEVIPAGIEVVKKAAALCGADVQFTEFPWGCDFYHRHGRMMDADLGHDALGKEAEGHQAGHAGQEFTSSPHHWGSS